MADGDGDRGVDEHGQKLIPSNEVSTIIQSRLDAESEKHRREMQSIMEENARLKATASPPPETAPKFKTREELSLAVENKEITLERANEIWDEQQEARITASLENKFSEVLKNHARDQGIQQTIDKYKSFDPTLNDPTSPARARVVAEIATQMAIQGTTKPTKAAEYAALRQIYGDVSKLTNMNIREHDRQGHQENFSGTGGHGMGDDRGGSDIDKFKSTLTPDERAYYSDLVSKNIYTWERVQDEMKHADPRLRARVAAK